MLPVRTRWVYRCRKTHTCEDCWREIPIGDQCLEVSRYEGGTVWSTYSCCKRPHDYERARWPKDPRVVRIYEYLRDIARLGHPTEHDRDYP